MTTTQTGLFIDMIAQHEGLAEELKAMDTPHTAEALAKEMWAYGQTTMNRWALDGATLIRAQAQEIERLRRARNLYEAALLAQNQQGAIGEVFDLWNAARAALGEA